MKFRPMSVRPVLCALFAGVVALAWSASPLIAQPTWGRPKETRPNRDKGGMPDEAPSDEGSDDAGEQGDEVMTGAKVSSPGRWDNEQDPEQKQPTWECEGDVWYAARTQAGVRFLWVLPADFEKGKAYDLVVLLHPSGENVRWGMSSHGMSDPDTGGRFAPNCIVVCVDGLTALRSRGKPGESRAFLASVETIMAFRDVMLELSRTLPVRRMYLYGTGTGADFALLFSQRFPALAEGVVLHRASAKMKDAAVAGATPTVFLHGAKDGLLNVALTEATYEAFKSAGHSGVRLRVMPSYNDYINPVRAEECLNWIVGMQVDDPGEALKIATGLLTPKSADEFGYVGPVWYGGAWEVLARFEAAKSQAQRGAGNAGGADPQPKESAGPGKKFETAPDEAAAGAAALRRAIEEAAHKHIAALKEMGLGDDAGAIACDGAPTAAYLWHFRQDFRGVPEAEAFFATIGYDAALAVADGQAALVRSAFEESNDAAERVNKVCSLVGSALLSPGLPLMLGSVAEQALSKQAGDLTPDGRESIELLENAEQTWNQGAKAYAKVWQTWSLDDLAHGAGADEPVETMDEH